MRQTENFVCANPACGASFQVRLNRTRPRKFCSHSCYTQAGGGRRDWNEKYQVTDEGRVCYQCKTWKTWDNYRKNQTTGVRGRTGTCEECWDLKLPKATWLFKRYGITLTEYDWLEKLQGGVCALCGTAERRKAARVPGGTSKKRVIQRLSVDHDHSCPNHGSEPRDYPRGCKECIRGLLCDFCNGRLLPTVESHPPLRARFEDYLTRRPFTSVPVRGGTARPDAEVQPHGAGPALAKR